MTSAAKHAAIGCALLVAGCATPPPVVLTPQEQYEPESVTVPLRTPMIESPPIEPVEPPLPAVTRPLPPPMPPPSVLAETLRQPSTGLATIVPTPPPAVVYAPAAPTEPTDDQQMLALLADLQRYGTLGADELRRELGNATVALGRQRTDANRVRLAVLYTLVRATPQDDQRALQLFDNIAKSNPGPTPIKQLAAVLQVQVTERQKAVRDEQKKADEAIQKLEALRSMERSLLRDRVRSGGGGGGGGGGSGGP
jgi:hypothetical protein